MTRSLLSSIVSTDYATHKLIANKKRDLRNDDNIMPYQEEKVRSYDVAGTYSQPYGIGQREKYQMSEHCVNKNPMPRDIIVPLKKNKSNEDVSRDVISAKGSCKECSLCEDLLEDLQSAVGHLKIVFESNICLGKLIDSWQRRCLVHCLILSWSCLPVIMFFSDLFLYLYLLVCISMSLYPFRRSATFSGIRPIWFSSHCFVIFFNCYSTTLTSVFTSTFFVYFLLFWTSSCFLSSTDSCIAGLLALEKAEAQNALFASFWACNILDTIDRTYILLQSIAVCWLIVLPSEIQ